MRLCYNFHVSHFGCKILDQTVQEPELTAKMPKKCPFQDHWLEDSAYQEWVLKDNLDKHYARCVGCKIQLFFVFLSVAMVLTKSNIGGGGGEVLLNVLRCQLTY